MQLVHCLNDIMLVSSGDCLVSNSPVLDNMKTGRRFNRKRDNDFGENKTKTVSNNSGHAITTRSIF